jgi:signal transduction histidine kinase
MSGRLYQKLKETDEDLCAKLDRIREKAIDLWDKGQYPSSLTEHGESHIDQVENNLDVLTRPLKKTALTKQP